MKKMALIGIGAFVLLLLMAWVIPGPAPSFAPATAGMTIPNYDLLTYESRAEIPFAGGKVWLKTQKGTNEFHWYWYDLETKRVLGELLDAEPVFADHAGQQLLCVQRPTTPNRQVIAAYLAWFSKGRIRIGRPTVDVFWSLDMESNKARKLGKCETLFGVKTTFSPSPDFRFGYNNAGGSLVSRLYLCDMEAKAFRIERVKNWPKAYQAVGWWSPTELIMKDTDFNFVRYDVLSGNVSMFFTQTQFSNAFAKANIGGNTLGTTFFPVWNGTNYDFYAAESQRASFFIGSYLFKVTTGPEPELQLVTPDLKYHFYGSIDPTGNYYVYCGPDFMWNSSAVYLRNLRDGSIRHLVNQGNSHVYYSLPSFYGDGIIYIHDRTLRWMNLNGSNVVQVFPPLN